MGRGDIAAKGRAFGNYFPSAHLAADAACLQRHLPTGSQCASDDGSIDRGNVLRGVDATHTPAVEVDRPVVVSQTPVDRCSIMRRYTAPAVYTASAVRVDPDRAVGQSDRAVNRFDRTVNGGVGQRDRTAVGADGTVDGIGSGRLHRAVLGSQRDVLVAGTDGIARQREPTVRNDGDMAEPAGIDLQRVTGRQVHGAVACEGVGAVTPAASAGGIGLVFTPEPETFPVERIARRMRATGQYRSKDQQPAAHQKGTVNFQSSRPLPSVFDMHNPAAPRVMLRSVQQRSGCTASGLFRSRGLGTRPAAICR